MTIKLVKMSRRSVFSFLELIILLSSVFVLQLSSAVAHKSYSPDFIDVTILDVNASINETYRGATIHVFVTVEVTWDVIDFSSFWVAAFYNVSLIDMETIIVLYSGHEIFTFNFTWNTSGVEIGSYIISAMTSTSIMPYIDGYVQILPVGNNNTKQGYSTIQEAINNATKGDTIFASSGTYHENVIVNKTVSLIGENRSTTIIDGNGTGIVIHITANNTGVSGFTIRRGEKGIYVGSGGFNLIANNTITSCGQKPYHYAVELGFYRAGHDIFENNELVGNSANVGIFGLCLSSFLIHMDTSNTVNGKPIYYLVNQSNVLVENLTHPEIGYLAVINSINVTVRKVQPVAGNRQDVLFAFTNSSSVEGCSFTNRGYAGIQLKNCSNVSITECMIANHYHGVRVDESNYNLVKHNLIRDNFWTGIVMEGKGNQIIENNMNNYEENIALIRCTNNSIFHNNFLGGWAPLLHESNINSWDNCCEGNYWSNYNGTDSDGDGIGDTPYIIDGNNTDHYPLMNLYWLPGDVNHDLKIDIYDVVRITGIYNSQQGDPNWNCHSDIAEPYGIIDIHDVVTCTKDYRKEYTP